MTTTIADELERRRKAGRRTPQTMFGDLADICREICRVRSAAWPDENYWKDPVRFFREILGVEPWSRQIEVIEAIRDNPRVAVRSGHKVSKSNTIAGVALCFYSSFRDAKVIMTSTTGRQVDRILWTELRKMHARSGKCTACKLTDPYDRGARPCPHSRILDGEPAMLARSGLRSDDFREIVGYTSTEAEAMQGESGPKMLYLVDEASGVPQEIIEAIEGNRAAAGTSVALFGNPTQTEGEHFEAFHKKKDFYKTLTISSEETPNVVEGREVIPGLASREWVEEKKREWGTSSALYMIRVKGVHALNEDQKILSVHALTQAVARWTNTEGEGRLTIGLDVAGEGEDGDETVFAPRRGLRIDELAAFRGLSADDILAHLLGILKLKRKPREGVPLVNLDREGPIGYRVWVRLRAYADDHPDAFDVAGVRASDGAVREPTNYDRRRDELWASAVQWFLEGGAIPDDAKLLAELHAPKWFQDTRGRSKVTPKRELKKFLKRSPDRAEAVVLACWVPVEHELGGLYGGGSESAENDGGHARTGADPYTIDGLDENGGNDPVYGD